MSVRVTDRHDSEIQYVYDSMLLRDYCTVQATKFAPKLHMYLISKLVNYAWECHSCCLYADMLYDDQAYMLEQQQLALLHAKRCCKDIDSATTLLLKKLRENPENFERHKKCTSNERLLALSAFLEKLAELRVRTEEKLDMRLSVVSALLIKFRK